MFTASARASSAWLGRRWWIPNIMYSHRAVLFSRSLLTFPQAKVDKFSAPTLSQLSLPWCWLKMNKDAGIFLHKPLTHSDYMWPYRPKSVALILGHNTECNDFRSAGQKYRFSVFIKIGWFRHFFLFENITLNGQMWCFRTVLGILNCNCCNTVVCETNFLTQFLRMELSTVARLIYQ